MKAFIVKNVKSMISIAEYAKIKKLPRLKIIPLDLLGALLRNQLRKIIVIMIMILK